MNLFVLPRRYRILFGGHIPFGFYVALSKYGDPHPHIDSKTHKKANLA